MQGLESRDDAAAYLQQLKRMATSGRGSDSNEVNVCSYLRCPCRRLHQECSSSHLTRVPPGLQRRAITSSVDDSVIAHNTTWKQLATWGGFRRHFKGEESQSPSAGITPSPPVATALASAGVPAVRGHVQEQLEAKRLEVLEARKRLQAEAKRLEDLLEAQQQLERMLLQDN